VDEFLVREAWIPAEGAMPFLGWRVQNFEAVNFVADGFGGTEAERFGEGAVEAQHAISGVVDDDEVGDGIEIFDPLLARLFHAREKPDIFQRHGGVTCQSFEQLAFGSGKFARDIYQAEHAEQFSLTAGETCQNEFLPHQSIGKRATQHHCSRARAQFFAGNAGLLGENSGEVMLRHGIPTMRGPAERCDFPFGISGDGQDCGARAQHFGRACGETA